MNDVFSMDAMTQVFPVLESIKKEPNALQYAAKDWIALNATKTGVVYRLHGNPPKSHE